MRAFKCGLQNAGFLVQNYSSSGMNNKNPASKKLEKHSILKAITDLVCYDWLVYHLGGSKLTNISNRLHY